MQKGTCAVRVHGKDVVVLGAEKKPILQLQDPRTVCKVVMLDLIDKARRECQSHRLTVEDPITVKYITRHIPGIQQVGLLNLSSICSYKYNSKAIHPIWRCLFFQDLHSRCQLRPTHDARPRLYQTEPSSIYSAWKVSSPAVSDLNVIFYCVILIRRQTPLVVLQKPSVNVWRRITKTIWLEKRVLSWLWRVRWRSYKQAWRILRSVYLF